MAGWLEVAAARRRWRWPSALLLPEHPHKLSGFDGLSIPDRSGFIFFFQAEDGIRDYKVTGVQTCALPIYHARTASSQRVAQGSCSRNREIRHHSFFPSGAAETARHRCEVTDGPYPLVPRRKRRCTLVLLSGRRGNGIRCAGSGTGLDVRDLGCRFPIRESRLGALVVRWRPLE